MGSGAAGARSPERTIRGLVASAVVAALVVAVGLGLDGARAAGIPTSSAPSAYQGGSYIVDLGQEPQTKPNALQPYGLVYDLLVNQRVPIDWLIRNNKVAGSGVASPVTSSGTGKVDEPDFTATVRPGRAGAAVPKTYKGSAFVIRKEYLADPAVLAAVNAYLAAHPAIVVDELVGEATLPRFVQLTYWPKTILDADNGNLAIPYYQNAGIPSVPRAYSYKAPSALTSCDDIFVMPHADPTWATHGNLLAFNAGGGAIWTGCHAFSVLENVDSPADPDTDPNLNFLTTNGALDFGDHGGASPPYSYQADGSDPFMQFVGISDAAHLNGSEQVYMPWTARGSRWRPTTKIVTFDRDQADTVRVPPNSTGPAAVVAYGRGMGSTSNGLVMTEGGHTLNKGTAGDVAAQRMFFNFLLMAGIERAPVITSDVPSTAHSGETITVKATPSAGSPNYAYTWSSSCGGTFGQATGTSSGNEVSTTFTAPDAVNPTSCVIRFEITDACGRIGFDANALQIVPQSDVSIRKLDQPLGGVPATAAAGPDPVASGEALTWVLEVANSPLYGSAVDVVVTDTLPAGTGLISAAWQRAGAGSCTISGNSLACALADPLPPGALEYLTIRAGVSTAATSITNTASVASVWDLEPANDTASATTAVIHPSITLEKTGSATKVLAGTAVTYTFVATNTGDVALPVPTLADSAPACTPVRVAESMAPDGIFEAGEAWTYTCTHVLAVDTTNVATLRTSAGGATLTATDSWFVDVVVTSMSIVKSTPTQSVPAGGVAYFSLSVTNTGDTPLANIAVTDPGATVCNRTIPFLAPGAAYTYSCALTVPLGTTPGVYANSASATADGGTGGPPVTASSNTVTYTVTAGAPSLAITKTSDADPRGMYEDEPLTYTIAVTNTGSVLQTKVAVSDWLPPGVRYVGPVTITRPVRGTLATEDWRTDTYTGGTGWATSPWFEYNGNGEASADGGKTELVSDGTVALEFDPDNRLYTIERAVNLVGYTSVTVSFRCRQDEDFNSADDRVFLTLASTPYSSATRPTPWAEAGNVYLHAGVGSPATCPDSAAFGSATVAVPPALQSATTYLLFGVTGDRRVRIDDIVVTGSQVQTTVVDAGDRDPEWVLTANGGPYSLDPGATMTLSVPAAIRPDLAVGASLQTNLASASSTQQTTPINAVATVTVLQPAIAVEKTASPTAVRSGETVDYAFRVTNAGDAPLTSVTLVDDQCSPPVRGSDASGDGDDTLELGEAWTYTCSKVVSAPPSTGPVVVRNEATATARDARDTEVSATATADVDVIAPAIALTVTPSATIVHHDSLVTFTYRAENTGNAPLYGVALTDPGCSPLERGLDAPGNDDGVLDPGEAWSWTCLAVAVPPTIEATPSVSGTPEIGDAVSDSASAMVTVIDPSLSVTKTASPATVVVGASVVYGIVVTNDGNDPLVDVEVLDDLCSPLTRAADDPGNDDAVLDPGESWVYACTDTPPRSVTNTATARAVDSLDGLVVGEASAEVTVLGPSLQLSKDGPAVARLGTPATYTFTVYNDGHVAYLGENLALADDRCPTIAYASGDVGSDEILDPGEGWVFTCTMTLAAEMEDEDPPGTGTGGVRNVATLTATGPALGPITAEHDVALMDSGVAVTKVADTAAIPAAGAEVTFTYTVSNTATYATTANDITLISITDDQCGVPGYLSGDDGDGRLNPGETWTYACTHVADEATNTVTVVYDDQLGVRGSVDRSLTLAVGELTVLKAASITDASGSVVKPKYDTVGDVVTYAITATNSGTAPLADVTVADPLLSTPGLTCLPALPAPLAPGDTVTCGGSHVVTQDDLDAGSIANTATASGTAPGGVPISGTGSATVRRVAVLAVEKAIKGGTPDTYDTVGDTLTYAITVTNTGSLDITGIELADTLELATLDCDPTLPAALAPGAALACEATYVVTQADLDAGSVVNGVTASGEDPDGLGVTASDSATATADQAPGLDLTKTGALDMTVVSPSDRADPGDTITYTLTATNSGNVTLTGVTIVDPKLGTLSCDPAQPATLAPTAVLTCTGSYALVQADIDAGAVDNTASATGTPPSGPDLGPTASASVPVPQAPTISIATTTNGSDGPTILVGQPVTWSYIVTNTGNVPLGVAVSDDHGVTVSCPATTLASGASMTCTADGVAVAGPYANVGTAAGAPPLGDTVTASDPSSYFGADPAIGIQKSPDTQTVIEGQSATFTIVVTNTGNVPLTDVAVIDALAPACAATLGNLAVGATRTSTCSLADVTSDFTNVATADGTYGLTAVSDSDDAAVVVDILPDVSVTKTADPTSVPETGADVEFNFAVTNGSSEPFILGSLTDDTFGDLDGQGTCAVPQTIAGGATYTCAITKSLASDSLTPHTNVVIASGADEQGNPDAASDDATVTFADVAPEIQIAKFAAPTSVPETGGDVTFSFLVENTGDEDVALTSLVDDRFGDLDGQGDCVTGGLIPVGGSSSCSITVFLSSDSLTNHDNVVTAVGTDDDGTTGTATAGATVTFDDVAPDITVTKTASPGNVPETGGNVTFTIVATNDGVEDVTLTSLSDSAFGDLDGRGDCVTGGLIPVGGSPSCSFTAWLEADDLVVHVNTVTAVATDDDGTSDSATDNETVTFSDVAPAVTLEKSVDVEWLDEPGGDFTFTLLVTNTSAEAVTITSLADDQSGDADDFSGCTALVGTTLAAGAEASCTYVVSHADAGSWTNTADVEVTDNDGSTATDSDTQFVEVVDVRPTVTLEKLVDVTTLPEPGGDFDFTLRITNTSVEPVMITALTDDNLPTESFPAYVGSWLDPGEVVEIPYTVSHGDAMTYGNTASVTVEDDEGTPVTADASQTVEVTDELPTVTLVKSVDVSNLPEPGGTFNFTLTVTNTSVEPVEITDLADDQFPAASGYVGTWLAPGEVLVLNYAVSHAEAGSYDNTAAITVMDNELNSVSSSDTETVTVDDVVPAVTLAKSADPLTLPEPGGDFTYALTVTNDSVETVTITGLTDDNLLSAACTGLVGTTLAAGAATSCTYTVARVEAGNYPNTATVTVADNEAGEATASATATVTVTDIAPSVGLAKSASPTSVPETGADVTFTIVVTNTGVEDVTIDSLVDSDFDLAARCPAAVGTALAPAGTYTCTFAELVAGDFEGDDHVNTATVVVSDNEAGTATASDDATVAFTDLTAAIDVEKDVSVDGGATWVAADAPIGPYLHVGTAPQFRFVVTNTGDVALGSLALTDSDFDLAACTIPATLAISASFECVISAPWAAGQHTDTATASGSFVDGAGTVESATATDDASYFGAAPGLTLAKTASPTEYDAVGESIGYSFELTNSGNVTLVGPFTVDDDRTSDEACPTTPASLAPGESITCTAGYSVTQDDLDAGSVTNTATGHAFFGATPVASPGGSATATAVQDPALALEKSGSWNDGLPADGVADAGESISYGFLVTNTGDVTLSDVALSDPLTGLSAISCPKTTLAVGDSMTCSATYPVTQADVDAGFVANDALATGEDPQGDPASDPGSTTVLLPRAPSLALDKSASPATYAAVGEEITYTFTLTNSGNVTLAGPFIVDDDRTTDEACPATARLAPGASITCTASYAITQLDLNVGLVTNVATASGSFDGDAITSDDDTATVLAVQSPSLALTKTADPATYDAVGDVIGYDYVVTNDGNVSRAGPVTVADDRATVTCPPVVSVGNLDLLLDPSESVTCTASSTIAQADLDAGTLVNTATASAGGTASEQATATATAVQEPALTLEKTASPATYDHAGASIAYSFTLTNTGNVTLVGPFTVDDDRTTDEACPATASLAPGASITCDASYTIVAADLDAGSVTNTATASASFDGAPVASGPDSATVTAVQIPTLTLDKSADTSTYDAVGDVIGYDYLVMNGGNVSLAGPVTVADDKVTVSCPAVDTVGDLDAFLDPGEVIACTAEHTITHGDLDDGSVVNAATASAGGTLSNPDFATVQAEQTRQLSLDKSASPATFGVVGDVVSYAYAVANTGNVTLFGPFTIADDRATATCPATASLVPGASLTCTASYTVTQADLNAGTVTNTATATAAADGTTSNADTETIQALQGPVLTLVKDAGTATFDHVGERIDYTYLVTNAGNVSLAGPVAIVDDKADVTCPDVSSVGNLDGLLDPGETVTCAASYTVTQADLDAGFVTNNAVGTADGTTSNADETVLAAQLPALSLTKAANPITYDAVGDTIAYTYVVTNTGNVSVTGPVGVDDDRATASCPATASLAPGASITCTASYTITQADLNAGSVMNTARASVSFGLRTIVSPPATATATATQLRVLTLAKTADSLTYSAPGDVIAYDYLVTNGGNVSLAGPVAVDDDKVAVSCPPVTGVGDLDAILDPGESVTCTASHTITQADLDAGSVTNTATAHADGTTSDVDAATVQAQQDLQLALTKTASPTTYDAVGDVIAYEYVVTNTGNVTLAGPVTVADDRATASCPTVDSVGDLDDFLDPGEALTCTASYAVSQADMDAGLVTNVASATNGIVTSSTDSATVRALRSPALSLAKTADRATYDAVGDVISYEYLLTNTGNVTLAGPFTVTDDRATVSCPATGSLAPLASITCTASYTVSQADLDAGSVTNTATATNGQASSAAASVTVDASQTPAVGLDKAAGQPTYDVVGEVVAYTYEVTNIGNVTLSGPFTVDDDKATVSCPATASLAPGASLTCSATYTITQADLDAGSVTNTATAHADFGATSVDSSEDTATVAAQQAIQLALDKDSVQATYAATGDLVQYTYLVTNDGNVTLDGPFTVTDDKVTVSCPATASLAPGASLTCTASYTVSQADLDAGSVTNTATATNGIATSPVARVTVQALQSPTLTLDKGASPTEYSAVGQVITYDFTLTNYGNVTLDGPFTVTDDATSDEACPTTASLAPTESVTCTATHTVSQADLDAGSVTNTASASGSFGGSPVTSPSDSVTVDGVQNPSLQLNKSATTATYDSVGDVVAYEYELVNNGNVTLAGPFSVADDRATVSCPATASLAPLASLTCTASYTVSQADLDAGSVTNTATASGSFDGSPVTSSEDSVTVMAAGDPEVTISKTPNVQTVAAGGTATFSITVRNTGNVTLADVAVVDAVAPDCDAAIGTLTPGAAHGPYTCTVDVTDELTNTAVATGTPPAGPDVTDSDTADVRVLPGLAVTKTPSTSTVVEPGADVTFTVAITNTSVASDPLTVETLTDRLDGGGSFDPAGLACEDDAGSPVALPFVVPSGSTWTCTFSRLVAGDPDDVEADTVTVTGADDEGSAVAADASATVSITDASFPLTVVKSTTTPTLPVPGGSFAYEVVITNPSSVDAATISAITDTFLDVVADGSCDGPDADGAPEAFPFVLEPGGTLTCGFAVTHLGSYPSTWSNTVTVAAVDADGVDVSGTSNEVTVSLADPGAPTITAGKTASSATVPADGADVTFTFTVGNASLEPVTITSLDDSVFGPLAGDADCATGTTLAAGASCSFEIIRRIEIAPGGPDHVNVLDVAAATGSGAVTTASARATVALAGAAPSVTLVKTVDRASLPEPGGDFTFTLAIRNGVAGPVTITDLVDTSAMGADCTALVGSTLAAGEEATCSYVVSHAAVGTYPNTAAVTVTDGDGATASATASQSVAVTGGVAEGTDLFVTKTVDVVAPPAGAKATYSITVGNRGPDAATNVVLTDLLPAGLTFVTASPSQGTYDAGTGRWEIGELANGASATLALAATVNESGDTANTATVTAGTFDPDLSNNTAQAFLTPGPTEPPLPPPAVDADLQLTKTVDQPSVTVGDGVTFTITVLNAGPAATTGVVVTDRLPTGLTWTGDDGGGAYDAATGTWSVGVLAAGQQATLSISATVSADGLITNSAEVTASAQPDPDSTPGNGVPGEDDTATATINATKEADLSLTKTVSAGAVAIGSEVTYTLTIHNAGPSVASGVLVRDVLPAGLRYVRHTGGAYDPRTGVWDVGTLAVGSPRTLRIVATITRPGTVSNVAEIVASDALDADSTPNNGVPTEDDQGLAESSASLPTPPPTTVGPGAHATDPAGRLVPVVVLLAIVWLVVDAWRVRPGRRRVVRRRAVRR